MMKTNQFNDENQENVNQIKKQRAYWTGAYVMKNSISLRHILVQCIELKHSGELK